MFSVDITSRSSRLLVKCQVGYSLYKKGSHPLMFSYIDECLFCLILFNRSSVQMEVEQGRCTFKDCFCVVFFCFVCCCCFLPVRLGVEKCE